MIRSMLSILMTATIVVGSLRVEATVRTETDKRCVERQCKTAEDCQTHECCLKKEPRRQSEFYCMPQQILNQACDPKFMYTCACKDGLECRRRNEKGRDHPFHNRSQGVEVPPCGVNRAGWKRRDKFVCTKSTAVANTTTRLPQKQQGGPTELVVVVVGETTEPPTTSLLSADEVLAQGGEGTCRWFTTPISECPSPCQGTVSRNVFCLCTPPNGVVNAEDANCERDDANVSKPVSELTCEVGCPDTARVTPSTDLGSAFEPTIALNFDPTEPTEPPTTIRLLTAAQIIELGGGGTCQWNAGSLSECSSTCAGVQTRSVFCLCTLATLLQVRGTTDNCERDDSSKRPESEIPCGDVCPTVSSSEPSTVPAYTATVSATTATVPTTTATDSATTATVSAYTETVSATTATVPTTTATDSATTATVPVTTSTFPVLFTAEMVINQGGGGACTWDTRELSECSATCSGIQTRDVVCLCTLSDRRVVQATEDNCVRDVPGSKPASAVPCSPDCPITSTITSTPSGSTTRTPTRLGTPTRRSTVTMTARSTTTATSTPTLTSHISTSTPSVDATTMTSILVTANAVLAQGGSGTCRWISGAYSQCSALCQGTQTRTILCICILSTNEIVKATEDNCLRDDDDAKPNPERACGKDCPTTAPTTSPSTTPTEQPTSDCPTVDIRRTRECDLTQCDDESDCFDEECCLQVTITHPKNSAPRFYCFPLLQLGDVCDVEANWTCPCRPGLQCQDDRNVVARSPRKKKKDEFYKQRPQVEIKKSDECPQLSRKKPKRHKKTKHDATCTAITSAKPTVVPSTTGRSIPRCPSPPSRPFPLTSCRISRCRNDNDCRPDDCCLNVEYEQGKGKHKIKGMTPFCVPLVDNGGACDRERKWSCPCRDGLVCTQQSDKKGKDPKDSSKHHRPKVTMKYEGDCPTSSTKRKAHKDVPTCQRPSLGRSRRYSEHENNRVKRNPVVVFASD